MYNLGDKVWFIERVYKDNPKLQMTDSNGIIWYRYEHPSRFNDVIFSGLVTGINSCRITGVYDGETSEDNHDNYEITYENDKVFHIYEEAAAFSSEKAAQNYLQSKCVVL